MRWPTTSAFATSIFTPIYNLTCGMAGLEAPPPEMLALYQAPRSNRVERNLYFGTSGGTVSVPDCYAPGNLRRNTGGAAPKG
jgi:hypothetical protein